MFVQESNKNYYFLSIKNLKLDKIIFYPVAREFLTSITKFLSATPQRGI